MVEGEEEEEDDDEATTWWWLSYHDEWPVKEEIKQSVSFSIA